MLDSVKENSEKCVESFQGKNFQCGKIETEKAVKTKGRIDKLHGKVEESKMNLMVLIARLETIEGKLDQMIQEKSCENEDKEEGPVIPLTSFFEKNFPYLTQ